VIKVTGHPFWRFAENRYCALNISPILIKFSPNVRRFFDDWNIFLNCLSELVFIIKISKIKKKPNTILKLTSLAMSCENLRKIG
jgi:hypothetical protein